MKKEDLPVIQKLYDYLRWISPLINNFRLYTSDENHPHPMTSAHRMNITMSVFSQIALISHLKSTLAIYPACPIKFVSFI